MLPRKLPVWPSPVWFPLGHQNIPSKTNTILLYFLFPLKFPGGVLAFRITLSPSVFRHFLYLPTWSFPLSRPLHMRCLCLPLRLKLGSLLQEAELSSRPRWGESPLLLWCSHGLRDGSLLGTSWLACLLFLLLWGPNWLLSSQHSTSDTREPRKCLLTELLEAWRWLKARWLPWAFHGAGGESRRSHPGLQCGLGDQESYLPTAPGGRLLCLFITQSKKKGPWE